VTAARAGRRGGVALLLLIPAMFGGCHATPPPVPMPRYLLGEPYTMGGLWSYPQETFALVETGLAAVMPPESAPRLTANGELSDPGALTAAHRTLQLPAIAMVTNLETGLALRLRVNDRGPAQPGRILALSPRAAALLGVPPDGAAQVRLEVDGAASRALAAALPGSETRGPRVEAAPRAEVLAEPLEPPPGARTAPARAGAVPLPIAGPASLAEADAAMPPDRLPEIVTRVAPSPGLLVLEVGRFFHADLARRQAARLTGLGARVQMDGRGRQAMHRVVLGPFASVEQADRAVTAAIAAGLPEVRLLVE
jgi:rare lipoprotein A